MKIVEGKLLKILNKDQHDIFKVFIRDRWSRAMRGSLDEKVAHLFIFGGFNGPNCGVRTIGILNAIYAKKAYNCFNELTLFLSEVAPLIYDDIRHKYIYFNADDGSMVGRSFFKAITQTNKVEDMVPWFENSKDFWIKAFSKNGLMYKDECGFDEMVTQGVLRAMHEIDIAESAVGIALHAAGMLNKNEVDLIDKITSENLGTRLLKNTMVYVEKEELRRLYANRQELSYNREINAKAL